MRKLEIRLETAERTLSRINQSHMDHFREIYEDRCAMLEALELVSDAYQLLHSRVKNDPQFMAKKAEIEPNF
ncbi:MAG: hypothetical protein RBT64_10425 [Trichloromonas sp.]|nr:hypothetical protein [Trichloromonas sp.]